MAELQRRAGSSGASTSAAGRPCSVLFCSELAETLGRKLCSRQRLFCSLAHRRHKDLTTESKCTPMQALLTPWMWPVCSLDKGTSELGLAK